MPPLLVVLPPTARRWGDWIVVDIPCYEAGQDKRDEKRCERKADGEKEGEALRGALRGKSTRCARQQSSHAALFYSCTSSISSPSRVTLRSTRGTMGGRCGRREGKVARDR